MAPWDSRAQRSVLQRADTRPEQPSALLVWKGENLAGSVSVLQDSASELRGIEG